MKSDLFFKSAFLILAAVGTFTWVQKQQAQPTLSQNQPVQIGRFVPMGDSDVILDTATGALYGLDLKEGVEKIQLIQEPIIK